MEIKTNIKGVITKDTRADCLEVVRNFRIRKLTPTECFTLQGVKPADIKLIQPNQSNSSQYHLAGDRYPANWKQIRAEQEHAEKIIVKNCEKTVDNGLNM